MMVNNLSVLWFIKWRLNLNIWKKTISKKHYFSGKQENNFFSTICLNDWFWREIQGVKNRIIFACLLITIISWAFLSPCSLLADKFQKNEKEGRKKHGAGILLWKKTRRKPNHFFPFFSSSRRSFEKRGIFFPSFLSLFLFLSFVIWLMSCLTGALHRYQTIFSFLSSQKRTTLLHLHQRAAAKTLTMMLFFSSSFTFYFSFSFISHSFLLLVLPKKYIYVYT